MKSKDIANNERTIKIIKRKRFLTGNIHFGQKKKHDKKVFKLHSSCLINDKFTFK